MPPLKLLKVYPFHNATVSALDRCGGPFWHRVIWSFFLLLIVVSFLLLCLAFSSSHFSRACSPDGYSNYQDFWRALPLSCTVPMLFEMNSTSVRIWESGCESLLLKSFLRCLAHQASTLFFSHRFSLHFRNTSAWKKKKEEERSRKRAAETLIIRFWRGPFPDIPRSCPRACWADLLLFSSFVHCERTETANERKLSADGKLRTKEN